MAYKFIDKIIFIFLIYEYKEKNLQISFFSIDQTIFCFSLQEILAKIILLLKNIYIPYSALISRKKIKSLRHVHKHKRRARKLE